jgi:hypothetical protein
MIPIESKWTGTDGAFTLPAGDGPIPDKESAQLLRDLVEQILAPVRDLPRSEARFRGADESVDLMATFGDEEVRKALGLLETDIVAACDREGNITKPYGHCQGV